MFGVQILNQHGSSHLIKMKTKWSFQIISSYKEKNKIRIPGPPCCFLFPTHSCQPWTQRRNEGPNPSRQAFLQQIFHPAERTHGHTHTNRGRVNAVYLLPPSNQTVTWEMNAHSLFSLDTCLHILFCPIVSTHVHTSGCDAGIIRLHSRDTTTRGDCTSRRSWWKRAARTC